MKKISELKECQIGCKIEYSGTVHDGKIVKRQQGIIQNVYPYGVLVVLDSGTKAYVTKNDLIDNSKELIVI